MSNQFAGSPTQEQTVQILRRIIKAMPASQREAMELYYLDSVGLEDIAVRMQVSEDEVRNMLKTSRQTMQEILRQGEARGIQMPTITMDLVKRALSCLRESEQAVQAPGANIQNSGAVREKGPRDSSTKKTEDRVSRTTARSTGGQKIALAVLAVITAVAIVFAGISLKRYSGARSGNAASPAAETATISESLASENLVDGSASLENADSSASASALSLYQEYLRSGQLDKKLLKSISGSSYLEDSVTFTDWEYAFYDVNGDGISELFYIASGSGQYVAALPNGSHKTYYAVPVKIVGHCAIIDGAVEPQVVFPGENTVLEYDNSYILVGPDSASAVINRSNLQTVLAYGFVTTCTEYGYHYEKNSWAFIPADVDVMDEDTPYCVQSASFESFEKVSSTKYGTWKMPYSFSDNQLRYIADMNGSSTIIGKGGWEEEPVVFHYGDVMAMTELPSVQDTPHPVTSATARNTGQETDGAWRDAYREIIGRYAGGRWDYVDCYYLEDINADSVPELIVEVGNGEADLEGIVFTWQNGEASRIGELYTGHSSLYTAPDGDGFLRYWGHEYAVITRYSMENGALSESLIMEYTPDWSAGEGFPPMEDLVPGSVPLQGIPLTDDGPLERCF